MFIFGFTIGFILGIVFFSYAVCVVSIKYPEEFDEKMRSLRDTTNNK